MSLVDPALRALYDLKVGGIHLCPFARIIADLIILFLDCFQIFVRCDSDLMLARRLQRDIVERGRDVAGILDQLVPVLPFTFMEALIYVFLTDIYDT